MQSEAGRIAAVNAAGVGSVAQMQTPNHYIPWFEVVHEIGETLYTFGDVADIVSMMVGLCVVTSTARTFWKARKK